MTWVSRLACLGILPSRKQFLRKPLPLRKIACESTVPYTTDSNNAPGIHIELSELESSIIYYALLNGQFARCVKMRKFRKRVKTA